MLGSSVLQPRGSRRRGVGLRKIIKQFGRAEGFGNDLLLSGTTAAA